MNNCENNDSVAMMFRDREHKERYFGALKRMSSQDAEHVSFVYLVTFVDAPINDCFDFANDKIKKDMLTCGWVTDTSRRVLALAMNLWNYANAADVSDIFSCVGDYYAEFMFYAIGIRFGYVPYLTVVKN